MTSITEAVEFLEKLRPGGPWVLTAVDPNTGAIETVTADTADDIVIFIRKRNGKRNLYYSVNPTRTAVGTKAAKIDIAAIEYALADLDPKDGEMADAAKARYLGQFNGGAFEPKPTAVIDSGNGIQCLWKLKEPIVLGDPIAGKFSAADQAKIDDVEARVKEVTLRLGSKAGTQNIDRVLRLPGTTNLPTKKKRKEGRVACPTGLLWFESATYPLEAFPVAEARTEPPGEDATNAGSTELPSRLATLLSVAGSGAYPTRSELLFAFITDTLRARVANAVIVEACLDQAHAGCGIYEHCKENGGKSYVERQIQQAQQKVKESLDKIVDDINREYALVIAGNKAAIMKLEGGSKFRLIQVGAFKQWFANQQVLVGKKMFSTAEYWLGNHQRRQYEGIEFDPGGGRSGYYNLWRGFAVEPREGDCSKFLAHLRDNVAKGNEDLFMWNVGWFAQIVQQPTVKFGTSLVYRGKMGVGKTKVGQIIGSLIGDDHYALVADPRYITGQFNSHMASLLLLQADEAFWAGDKRGEGKLRDLITGIVHFLEFKGIDPIQVRNFIRLFVTGNQDWIIPAGFGERRFAVFDVGEDHMQDHPYFAAIDEEMNNGGREALLYYLLNFDLSRVNLRVIPKTVALFEQKIESATPEQAWWLDTLKNGKLPQGTDEASTCLKTKLYRRYIQHANLQGVRRKVIETTIGMFLNKYVGSDLKSNERLTYKTVTSNGVTITKRGWCYRFPPLSDCRAQFAREMQQEDIAWGDVTEWCHEDEPVDPDDEPF